MLPSKDTDSVNYITTQMKPLERTRRNRLAVALARALKHHRYDAFWLAVAIGAIVYLLMRFTPSQLWHGIQSVR